MQRMLEDIYAGRIDCVVVKDLSRFGRDYIDMGYYLERWFPSRDVRFIAVNDAVDSLQGPYDMLLPLKNVFNTQYARDISSKVRSSFATKQRRGGFVGAFASYGYLKDPDKLDICHRPLYPAKPGLYRHSRIWPVCPPRYAREGKGRPRAGLDRRCVDA